MIIHSIKAHGNVSAPKKGAWHTTVLFYRKHKVTVFNPLCLYNYWTNLYHLNVFYALHIHDPKNQLKEISSVVCGICVPENQLIFFTFFFFVLFR